MDKHGSARGDSFFNEIYANFEVPLNVFERHVKYINHQVVKFL
jgi:hypothetical protein